ncbi:excinuclease ABC subunit UvrA [Candidatus Woesearchaeota archaeon]|nr:excinuclease ABC subunit UvrA [Candidatus Woesearchaeota archaeon]
MKNITIKGARQHNLKNIDVVIPRNKLVVITGLSGSGKSSLAFDTIYAEGQRRYVESLSAYARQFLGLMTKPDVDSIEGLSPAISIEQKTTSKNPRSTVGTITEVYDYLRLLYARIGIPYCPEHKIKIKPQTPEKIYNTLKKQFKKEVTILSPVIRQKKGTYAGLFKELNKQGFTRVRVNGKYYRTDEKIKLERYKKHDIDLVIDRTKLSEKTRVKEAVENALKESDGLLIAVSDNKEKIISSKMACPECGLAFEELQPRMFSFNSPFGACPACSGLGIKMEFDPDLIIPDKSLSIADGAIKIYRNAIDGWRGKYLGSVAKHFGFSVFTPISELSQEQYEALMFGSSERIKFNLSSSSMNYSKVSDWEGLLPQSERLYHQTNSDYRRKQLEKFMRVSKCPECQGKRLKKKILSVLIDDKSIAGITELSIKDNVEFFEELKLTKQQKKIARLIVKEIKERLGFLDKVGLSYLTLDREAGTLSGGEAQRIRLATQIGSNLTGITYILDEPSIGLHQRDNAKLIDTLMRMRDKDNTIVVVEHDEETIVSADHVIDMGPGAGIHGGGIVAEGTPENIKKNTDSLTGKYLSRELKIPTPEKRRPAKKFLKIKGGREHNLKDIDVNIPLETLTLVTGVSGSGKSTLVYDILYKAMKKKVYDSKARPGKHEKIISDEKIDKVIVIDQSPIGRTPRSNPATYTKVFDYIREVFAKTTESKIRGYKKGRFSFNTKGGRCEECSGKGVIKIEMNFLPDIYINCEECEGKRYNRQTLDIKYKGKTISDVLDMTVEEAFEFFSNQPKIKRKLKTLKRVGLSYIKLGQSSTTLSGGEAQRIKLTRELSKRSTGNTLYLLDEPTTGLHFHDVKKLIKVLDALVEKGNTVVVIEHNLDVVKSADYIVDLGPEGGEKGGYLIAEGTPEEVSENEKSYTGKWLKKIL